jgi:membrane protease YdiL (CAAX protease family)
MVEAIKAWAKNVDAGTLACVPGVAVLALWLLRNALGRTALKGAPVRRNHVALLAGGTLISLLAWMVPPPLILSVLRPLAHWTDWRSDLLANVVMACTDLATVVLVLVVAAMAFSRGLKGLGLRWTTIPRDAGAAVVNLLAIWPVLLAMVALVLRIGELRYGPTYRMEQHKELELLTTSPHLALQISVVVLAVAIAPAVEELLFRGLIQSAFRSLTDRPWPAVFLSSMMFTMVHANVEHWPALFVLAVGMGYSYEKSGSLWRPIFIHGLFNSLTILSNL